MIIFDSSVLYGQQPDDPKFDVLLALRQSGQQRAAIPWMVREELVAHRVLRHAQAHREAVSAIRELNRVAGTGESEPRPFDRDAISDRWRKEYDRLFKVIDTSGEAARKALLREANCQKPAKEGAKDKGGARDAAIWFSVVEYLKNNPGEKVYFVTANTRDFGDGSEFPGPMADDIEGIEDRLEILTSFDSVVSVFSTPLAIDADHIQNDLVGLLSSEAARKRIARNVTEQLAAQTGPWGGNEVQVFLAGLASANTYQPVRWGGWDTEPRVVLRRVRNAAGHRIGDDDWYTAVVDWILVGRASVPSSSIMPFAVSAVPVPRWIACEWRTKLLFSNREGEAPTLLKYWPPATLNASEQDEWEPLVRAAVPQITTSQLSGITSEQLSSISGSPLGLAILAAGLLWAITRKKPDDPEIDEPD